MRNLAYGLTSVVLIGAFVLSIIGIVAHHMRIDPDRQPISTTTNVKVFIDPDTGCHYLTSQRGGITPRITADGKQLCIL